MYFHVAAATGPDITRPVPFRDDGKLQVGLRIQGVSVSGFSRALIRSPENVIGSGGKKLLTLYLVFTDSIDHNIQTGIPDDTGMRISIGCP
jgi:hypothetical protein